MSPLRTLVLACVLLPLLPAQDPKLRFEVATAKRITIALDPTGRTDGPDIVGGPGTTVPTQIAYQRMWLLGLITMAFGVQGSDVTGPGWMNSERYDIQAVVPEGATKEQVNIMLQNLLIDRFHLKIQRGSKMYPVYLLRVGRNGPKLKLATEEGLGPAPDAKYPTPAKTSRGITMKPDNDGGVYLSGHNATMAQLASTLSRPSMGSGRRVIDETGLTGVYDFRLAFMGDFPIRTPAADPIPLAEDAVETLGLKLEKAERPYPTIIVESIDREPTEN